MSNNIDYGIDLGTTNSLIAKFNKGSVDVLRNPIGWKDTTPSVVGFRKDRILVGDKAREFQEKAPENVAGLFKRKMGTTEMILVGPSRNPKSPVELSAHVLKELRTFVQSGEKVDSAVITVPASFDLVQSNATKKAAEQAGLSNVVLLQEPIAASLAYANQRSTADYSNGKWLVYDLGGGTFDVALVKVEDGEMRILDHEGDNYLGGTDFDRLIVEHLIVPYISSNFDDVDIALDFQSASGKYNALFYKLLRKAEDAKKELSSQTSTEIDFEFEDEDLAIEITRSDFENIIREPINRTAEMVRTILTRNALTPNDLKFILLVGGSTYIPFVRSRIEELLRIPVKTDIDPTTAVVFGAAYYAGTKEKSISIDADQSETNYEVLVKAVFQKSSRENVEPFFAKITGEIDGLYYRITRGDGGFDSGLRELKERISEELTLVNDDYNVFTFSIFDGQNNKIETNFSDFGIAHNIVSISGQPLPEDICLELDNSDSSYLDQVFRKGTSLPSRQVRTVTATRTVTKGTLDEALYINVVQGDSSYLPESAKHVGTLTIHGSELNRDLVKGSEIELSIEINESRIVTVNAFIPYTGQSFERVFHPKEHSVETEWLQIEIQSLLDKIDSNVEVAKRRQDSDLLRELNAFAKDVDQLEDRVLELSIDDVTDIKYQIDNEKNRIAQKVNIAIQRRQADVLLEEYIEARRRCEVLIDDCGTETNKEHLAEIVVAEQQYIEPPSPPHLKAKIGELNNLYYSVLWRQPPFLTNEFNWIVEQEKLSDSDTVQRLIEQGQVAIIDGDFDSLRNIIFRLYDLMPKEKRQRRQTKTGIG